MQTLGTNADRRASMSARSYLFLPCSPVVTESCDLGAGDRRDHKAVGDVCQVKSD